MNPKTIQNTITHLQIIHTWAAFDLERGTELGEKCLRDITNWSLDAVKAIEGLLAVIEEQRGMIDRLEHELGAKTVLGVCESSERQEQLERR